MLQLLIIVLFGFGFAVLARWLGLGRLVRPGIGGLHGWRPDGWPRGVQEDDPDKPWGRGEAEQHPG